MGSFAASLFLVLLGAALAQKELIRYDKDLVASCTDLQGEDLQGEVLEGVVSSKLSDTITVIANASCSEDVELQGVNVHVSSINATSEHPVVIVARQGVKENIFSWRIPYHPDNGAISFSSVDRSLCPVNISSVQAIVYLDIYTSSPQDVHYAVSVQLLPRFSLQLNDSVQFLVTPASPQISYFKFPPGKSAAKIRLDALAPPSSSRGCFILSAQKKSCPFNYLEENIKTEGLYQSVNTTAVLEIKVEELLSDEVIIAVIAVSCGNADEYSNQTFNLTIVDSPQLSEFRLMIVLPVMLFFVGVVPVVILCTILYIFISFDYLLFCKMRVSIQKCGDRGNGGGEVVIDKSSDGCQSITSAEKDSRYGLYDSAQGKATVQHPTRSADVESSEQHLEEEAERRHERDIYIATCGKEICCPNIHYKHEHFINEKPNEDYTETVNRNFMFLWNTIIFSIYYGLPALQHLYTLIQVSKNTGEGDTCYFNFKCAHSVGLLTSFNNFWSNIVYVLFGALFLVIAVIKNVTYCVKRRKHVADHIGLPEYFGMYYAMGVLAIMQGVMSAFYHICPTKANFQYDTTCMVIFGGLIIVHIIYKRRPLIRVNAGLAYVLFSFITSLILLGLIADGFIGEGRKDIFLSVVFILLAVNFTAAFYFLHDWTFLGGCMKKSETKDGAHMNFYTWIMDHKWKVTKVIVGTVMNVLIAIVYISSSLRFVTAVLGLFIINGTFFLVFYTLAKIYYKEYLSFTSTVMGVLTLAFLIPAAYCLIHTQYDTELAPAESRQLNMECTIGRFYDIHDIWHFLSAIAMFFCYLYLLTLDDGVSGTRRSKIPAF